MKKVNNYIFNLTIKYIIINTILISILILFINSIEISRIIENNKGNLNNFLYLSFLKLPSIISETIPFIIIIAISFLYKNLISNNELISLRNMGLSILDIFKPVALSIFIFGILILLFLNPIAAKFDNEFSNLTNKKNNDIYTIKFINEGMWIKNNINNKEKIFISISSINLENMKAKDIKILEIKNNQINLITAKIGLISSNFFKLNDVNISNINKNSFTKINEYNVKLNFDKKDILQSIVNYKFVPFYKYKAHINNLKKFNLYSSEISLFYLSEIIKPFFLVIIGFVVMGFAGKYKRNDGFFKVLFISLLIGFMFFLLKEIIINLTTKLSINFFLSYLIILITPISIGLYQMIKIESD